MFMHLIRCEKAFFLHAFHPELKSFAANEPNIQLENGKAIGELGRRMYSGGYDLSQGGLILGRRLVDITQQAIRERKHEILYEPAFISKERHLYFQADIMILNKNVYRMVEFKSGTYFKEPYYLYDIGFQARVLYDNGYTKRLRIYAALINKHYVRNGDIKLDELFTHHDVTENVFRVQPIILKKLDEAYSIIAKGSEPEVTVGKHCIHPYKCAFYEYCYQKLPTTSLLHVKTLSENQVKVLIEQQVQSVNEIPANLKISKEQLKELKGIFKSAPIYNKKALGNFLSTIEYPIAFMDFETINLPYPLYDGISPYIQIPFQFCYLKEISHGRYARHDFLAPSGTDPRKHFIERLIVDSSGTGSILVYNAAFEKAVLNSLAKEFPQYKQEIKAIIERIIDLMEPFRKKDYWHRSFGNGYSIKVVLPVLCPDFSYDTLQIRNGNMAMLAYMKLDTYGIAERREVEVNLKEYCHMDTIGMAKILDALIEIAE